MDKPTRVPNNAPKPNTANPAVERVLNENNNVMVLNIDDPAFKSTLARELAARSEKKEGFVQRYWRPAMAILYLIMCTLDYVVRPLYNEIFTAEFNAIKIAQELKGLEISVQMAALEIAAAKENWGPILNEFVHLAFGAIIGAAATTRGLEKTQRAKMPQGAGQGPL